MRVPYCSMFLSEEPTEKHSKHTQSKVRTEYEPEYLKEHAQNWAAFVKLASEMARVFDTPKVQRYALR